ncbi:hypothetical protein J6590_100905 [Homalodisca vitripennis]|nr:hypothetical protein J6590_100905 [Homalodisca vitripennis]
MSNKNIKIQFSRSRKISTLAILKPKKRVLHQFVDVLTKQSEMRELFFRTSLPPRLHFRTAVTIDNTVIPSYRFPPRILHHVRNQMRAGTMLAVTIDNTVIPSYRFPPRILHHVRNQMRAGTMIAVTIDNTVIPSYRFPPRILHLVCMQIRACTMVSDIKSLTNAATTSDSRESEVVREGETVFGGWWVLDRVSFSAERSSQSLCIARLVMIFAKAPHHVTETQALTLKSRCQRRQSIDAGETVRIGLSFSSTRPSKKCSNKSYLKWDNRSSLT